MGQDLLRIRTFPQILAPLFSSQVSIFRSQKALDFRHDGERLDLFWQQEWPSAESCLPLLGGLLVFEGASPYQDAGRTSPAAGAIPLEHSVAKKNKSFQVIFLLFFTLHYPTG